MEEQNSNEQQNATEQQSVTPQPTVSSNSNDAEKNKIMAIVGYIIPILFFIPLVTDAKDSPFAKFHANQQLILLIGAIIVNVVGVIPVIGWFIILPLGIIVLIVFAIMGIINAAKGEMKELPLIGGFKIIN